jgi:hypothetical protein
MRHGVGDKSIQTERAIETSDRKYIEREWMSEEVMDQRVGKNKALKWRKSGRIPWRPDSVTKSTDPEDIEWGVPREWQTFCEGDITQATAANSEDATEEKLKMLGFSSPSGPEESPAVKPEPPHPVDNLKEEVTKFRENCKNIFKDFQNKDFLMKRVFESMTTMKNPFTEKIEGAIDKHSKQLSRFVKSLEKMLIGSYITFWDDPYITYTPMLWLSVFLSFDNFV